MYGGCQTYLNYNCFLFAFLKWEPLKVVITLTNNFLLITFKAIELFLTKQERVNASEYIDCLKEIEALLGTYYNPVGFSNHTLFVVNQKRVGLNKRPESIHRFINPFQS